jgi:hypothetical protein
MDTDHQTEADRARRDLARRLGADEGEIVIESDEPADFPDAALGAPIEDEMSAQVITSGRRIRLRKGTRSYEYRAGNRQLRLVNFNGENYKI